jgi:hypothetical protein
METAHEAKIVAIPHRMQKRFGRGKMLIPKPLDVDAMIRKVPRGKLLTLTELREKLARAAGADVTCPLVSGIHVRVVAEAAAEEIKPGSPASRPTGAWFAAMAACSKRCPAVPPRRPSTSRPKDTRSGIQLNYA